MTSEGIKKYFFTLLFLAKDITKGKYICKTVSFCCLATFLGKKYKRS